MCFPVYFSEHDYFYKKPVREVRFTERKLDDDILSSIGRLAVKSNKCVLIAIGGNREADYDFLRNYGSTLIAGAHVMILSNRKWCRMESYYR
jgi:hypothetical protein